MNEERMLVGGNKMAAHSPGKVFKAICEIKHKLEAVERSQVNVQQRFKYRGIDDLYNALAKLEAEHGVFSVPTVLEEKRTERPSKSGGTLIHTVLRVQYRFYADDGSYFDAVVVSEGMDSGDKGANKALSIAHKYALTQIYCVRTSDQHDPDGESHQVDSRMNPPMPPRPTVYGPGSRWQPTPTGPNRINERFPTQPPKKDSP